MGALADPAASFRGWVNLAQGPNLGYPQNWKLHGFNPLFFGIDPNSLLDEFIGTKANLPPKFSFSSDFGHFILKMLENAKLSCARKKDTEIS